MTKLTKKTSKDGSMTCHVKIFYDTVEKVEQLFNTFMDVNYKHIDIQENKSFYVLDTKDGVKMGLLTYYLTKKEKQTVDTDTIVFS